MSAEPSFVSIIMPVLNEERYVEQALLSLLGQVGEEDAEFLVMDGGSHDETRTIVMRLAAAHSAIRLINNPARIQSAACNLAAELADPRSRILIRTDAHAAYPPDFISCVVAAMRRTGATSVVVPMRTVGRGFLQRAIAAAQNSKLGNGGSRHRSVNASQFVDHGHHAAFDAAFFRGIGGYDPTFTHNEDAELDVRANMAGGRVWLCAEAAIDYFPRESLRQLARQYVRHGRGRARTVLKHRLKLKLRQCVPLASLLSVAAGAFVPLSPLVAVPASAYVGACLLWGATVALRRRDRAMLLMGPASITMHLAWAVGFLDTVRGTLRPVRLRSISRLAPDFAAMLPTSKTPQLGA